MRNLRRPAVLLALLLGGVAFASTFVIEPVAIWFKRGAYFGTGATASANNLLTRSPASGAITYNCGEIDAGTCGTSPAQTLTGAQVGDTCTIGPPAAAGALNGTWSCYVSAADAVKINFCADAQNNIDPASGSFRVRTFSNQ